MQGLPMAKRTIRFYNRLFGFYGIDDPHVWVLYRQFTAQATANTSKKYPELRRLPIPWMYE